MSGEELHAAAETDYTGEDPEEVLAFYQSPPAHPGDWRDLPTSSLPSKRYPEGFPRGEYHGRRVELQHGQGVSPYHDLAATALDGAAAKWERSKAWMELGLAAETDPNAQAILDATQDEYAASLQERKMKITKNKLKQIIKEELKSVMEAYGVDGGWERPPEPPVAYAKQYGGGEAPQDWSDQVPKLWQRAGKRHWTGERIDPRGFGDEDIYELARELRQTDGWDTPEAYYDEYLQTAKEILLGHPDGMNHRTVDDMTRAGKVRDEGIL